MTESREQEYHHAGPALEPWLDDPEIPTTITSVFGQTLPLVEHGAWSNVLVVEHVGFSSWKVPWAKEFHRHPYIDWVVRLWIIERIALRAAAAPVSNLIKRIKGLRANASADQDQMERALARWYIANGEATPKVRDDEAAAVRAFYAWGVSEGLRGFSEDHMLPSGSVRMPRGANTSWLQEDSGPFTQWELSQIKNTLERRPDLLRAHVIFELGREWGLRPVQLSLLREADLDEDELGPYLHVPSAKGQTRSLLRRAPANLRRRPITAETAGLIRSLMRVNELLVAELKQRYTGYFPGHAKAIADLPTPLFPGSRSENRAQRFITDPGIREYLLHTDSTVISREVVSLTHQLKIPTVESPSAESPGPGGVLPISSYRLRHTRAVSMALDGYSADEIADALDHTTMSTVSRYLQLSPDVIDYLDGRLSKSAQIIEAAAYWSGRTIDRGDASAERGTRAVSDIGRCASTHCDYEPRISCYGCSRFRPYRDADHRASEREIELRVIELENGSSGGVARQLDSALVGVKAIIAELEAGSNDESD